MGERILNSCLIAEALCYLHNETSQLIIHSFYQESFLVTIQYPRIFSNQQVCRLEIFFNLEITELTNVAFHLSPTTGPLFLFLVNFFLPIPLPFWELNPYFAPHRIKSSKVQQNNLRLQGKSWKITGKDTTRKWFIHQICKIRAFKTVR